ncbi:MAG: hypothetical protein KF690_02365 [Bacteroidetes bacterium]|nr:hypothetical protein [Bacteroidota bacterium]
MHRIILLSGCLLLLWTACAEEEGSSPARTPPIQGAGLPWPVPHPPLQAGQWVLAPTARALHAFARDADSPIDYYSTRVEKVLKDNWVIVQRENAQKQDTLRAHAVLPLGTDTTLRTPFMLTFDTHTHLLSQVWHQEGKSYWIWPSWPGSMLPQLVRNMMPQWLQPIDSLHLAGAPLRYETPHGWAPGILLYRLGDTYVIYTHLHTLRQEAGGNCRLMLAVPRLQAEQRVEIPVAGLFRPGTVLKNDPERGGALVEFTFAGKNQTAWFGFGQISTDIRQHIP